MLECLRLIETPSENGMLFSKNFRAYIYHQLCLLYFYRARLAAKSENFKASADLFKKSMIAAKKAVAYNQKQYTFWNSLGIIAYCK